MFILSGIAGSLLSLSLSLFSGGTHGMQKFLSQGLNTHTAAVTQATVMTMLDP